MSARGRDIVREATGAYLASAGSVGERRRCALLLLGACRCLQRRHEGEGARAINRARQMAQQGLMAGLEARVEAVPLTAADIISRAPPRTALQLLRSMTASSVIQDGETLLTFLRELLTNAETQPKVVILVGEWIADGLRDEPLQATFRALASTFASLVAARAKEDERWCVVAAEALPWLPGTLHSEDLRLAASKAPERKQEARPASQAQEWSVDPASLPAYSLPVETTVTLVDSIEDLEEMRTRIAPAKAVAVDTEFGTDAGSLCLVQVAVEASCFLVDVRPNLGDAFHNHLRSVLETVFDRRVLAWSFKEDCRRLRLLHSELSPALKLVTDLQPSARRRLGLLQMPSLQRACAELLGVALDKAEQRSNWERRPLTETQRQYAASDAVVLFALAGMLAGEECASAGQ